MNAKSAEGVRGKRSAVRNGSRSRSRSLVCLLRVYGVCVCYGPTGRGTRTEHPSGTRNSARRGHARAVEYTVCVLRADGTWQADGAR
eukprot:5940523-Prymnesium_polylepis.1